MRRQIGICLLLGLVTLAVYWPVRGFEFTNYDDPEYVVNNSAIQAGITGKSVLWAFSSGYASNWHPVTWISHMLDCRLFGLNAGWHHLTSLLLHAANAILLFWVLYLYSRETWTSFFVAALFAWHPLHVESVAWISERKDVLSTFFWLLAMAAYQKYCERAKSGVARVRAFYLTALFFHALGLMSKPMMVTFPFVLLLLDYWPLQRITLEEVFGMSFLQKAAPLVIEKVPFFVLSALDCVVTWWVQKETQAMVSPSVLSLGDRFANAAVSYLRYLGKAIWPADLAVLYPYPDKWPLSQVLGAVILLAAVSMIAFRYRRDRKYLFVGWFWFLGTLVPVIGLIQVGIQSMADRYTYIPLIGIFIIAAWGMRDLFGQLPYRENVLGVASTIILGGCLISTWIQVHYWRDSITLFSHTVAVTTNNIRAEYNLAEALARKGNEKDAAVHYLRAIKLHPNSVEANYNDQPEANRNLALILVRHGQFAQAEPLLRQTVRDKPQFFAAHNDLGGVLLSLGKLPAAIDEYRTALQSSPGNTTARLNLATALAENRNFDLACGYYRELIRQDPNNPLLHNAFGLALDGLGRFDEAVEQLRLAVNLGTPRASAHLDLGGVLSDAGKPSLAAPELETALQLQPDLPESLGARARFLLAHNRVNAAESALRSVLRLRPNDADAHYQLALVLALQRRSEAVIPELRESLRLNPGALDVMNDLAWILATDPRAEIRNGTEAVRLAERICELTKYETARYCGTLDAAYAEAGLMDRAVAAAKKTAELARSQGLPELADLAEKRLQMYLADRPYHRA